MVPEQSTLSIKRESTDSVGGGGGVTLGDPNTYHHNNNQQSISHTYTKTSGSPPSSSPYEYLSPQPLYHQQTNSSSPTQPTSMALTLQPQAGLTTTQTTTMHGDASSLSGGEDSSGDPYRDAGGAPTTDLAGGERLQRKRPYRWAFGRVSSHFIIAIGQLAGFT